MIYQGMVHVLNKIFLSSSYVIIPNLIDPPVLDQIPEKRIRKKYLSICKYHSRRKCLEKSFFLTVSIIMAPFSLNPERFKGRLFQVMNYFQFSLYLLFSFKDMSSLVFELTYFAFLIWILSVCRFQFVKPYVLYNILIFW